MIEDRYGGEHSTTCREAIAAFERAVIRFAAHRPFLPDLDTALALDPPLAGAIAFQGIAHALIGRESGMIASRNLLHAAQSALRAASGGTPHEQCLVKAHGEAARGHLKAAATALEEHLADHPRSLLALKLAHALRFMSGDTRQMLETSTAALAHWDEATPGLGYALGCRAFALEENGFLQDAEDLGRRALLHDHADVWALHAVAHVLETDHRTREGRILLESGRRDWSVCGGFGQHLAWHLALFHLDEGDHGRVLGLYDETITPSEHGCFRDMANAVSLLWRLEQEGVAVGDRWDRVHEIARARRRDATYAFGSLHYLIALLARSDTASAQDLIAAMRLAGHPGGGDQTAVITQVALPIAEALVASTRRDLHRAMSSIASRLPAIGGSHAQRDVFLRTLMLAAAEAQDHAVLATLSELRRQQRRDDRFSDLLKRRTVSGPASARSALKEAV